MALTALSDSTRQFIIALKELAERGRADRTADTPILPVFGLMSLEADAELPGMARVLENIRHLEQSRRPGLVANPREMELRIAEMRTEMAQLRDQIFSVPRAQEEVLLLSEALISTEFLFDLALDKLPDSARDYAEQARVFDAKWKVSSGQRVNTTSGYGDGRTLHKPPHEGPPAGPGDAAD